MVVRIFLRSQSGAVTVDWVVLAAAVVGIGVATVGVVSSGVGNLGGGISNALRNASVVQVFRALAGTYPAYFLHLGGSPSATDSRVAHYQALIDTNVANADDDTLHDLYQLYIVHEDAARVAAEALRQQLSESGSYDYADLSRIITENGHSVVFSESFMNARAAHYGGDLEDFAVNMDYYAPVMGSFSDAYGAELIRRGVPLED